MPPVTPDDVAEYAPGSPAVSVSQLQQASDWAEWRIAGRPLPTAGTAEARALVRAICAYALSLAVGLSAQTLRTSTVAMGAKKIKVGPIELERPQIDAASRVTALIQSAADWLALALQALAEAGYAPAWRPVTGVSR